MEDQNFKNIGSGDTASGRSHKRIFVGIIIILVVLFILGSIALVVATSYFSSGKTILSWASKNEQNLAGYRIYYGTSPRKINCPPGGYSNSLDAGMNPTYQFKDLQVNSTYYFSVAPYYHVPAIESHSGTESGCFLPEISKKISAPNFWEFLKGQTGAL